jgi:hypothetical protein
MLTSPCAGGVSVASSTVFDADTRTAAQCYLLCGFLPFNDGRAECLMYATTSKTMACSTSGVFVRADLAPAAAA